MPFSDFFHQVEEGREHPGKVLFPNLESLYLGVGRDSSLNQVHTLITGSHDLLLVRNQCVLTHSLLDRLLTWCRKLRTLYMSGIHQSTLYTLLNDHLGRPGVSPRVNDSYLEARLQQGSLHSLESCTIKEDVSVVQDFTKPL